MGTAAVGTAAVGTAAVGTALPGETATHAATDPDDPDDRSVRSAPDAAIRFDPLRPVGPVELQGEIERLTAK